jgi:hypothetical protein
MSPMKGRSAVIGATALAATAALGLPGAAYAQSSDQPSQSESARPGPGHRGPDLETAARVLGLDVDDLRTKLDAGSTLAAVAGEQDVDVQTLVDALVAKAGERLDEAVADGKLTADEAAERKGDLPDRIERFVNSTRPPGGPGGPAGRGGPALDKAATALGLSVDDLRSKLQDGQTLAQVAQAQGVDVQTLVDALVADATARIDQGVADGRLTADEATERKAELPARIADLVQNGPPAHPGGPPPDGAPAGRGDGSS